jgi:L-aspartate-alpha-decarboxylase
MQKLKFCPICRSRLANINDSGNTYLKCSSCEWIYYGNPLPAVAAFVINNREEVLLVKRGVEPCKGSWALPSGFIEQKETPEHAVIRELYEETGVNASVGRLLGAYLEPTRTYGNVLLIGYELLPVSIRLRPGSDCDAARFFPLKKLPVIAFASHRSLIRDWLRSRKTASGYIEILKSKITEAHITKTQLHYKGSMGIDRKIMDAVGMLPDEKVHVLNYDNGERFETYVIAEKSGSGKFVLYGPAAHKGKPGDKLCILSYMFVGIDQKNKMNPKIAVLDKKNRILKLVLS